MDVPIFIGLTHLGVLILWVTISVAPKWSPSMKNKSEKQLQRSNILSRSSLLRCSVLIVSLIFLILLSAYFSLLAIKTLSLYSFHCKLLVVSCSIINDCSDIFTILLIILSLLTGLILLAIITSSLIPHFSTVINSCLICSSALIYKTQLLRDGIINALLFISFFTGIINTSLSKSKTTLFHFKHFMPIISASGIGKLSYKISNFTIKGCWLLKIGITTKPTVSTGLA